ncbi:MAG: preprotein translocase subunit SecA, partial [Marinobacter maritimus]
RVQSREEMEEVERRRKEELEQELAKARLRHDETSATAQSEAERAGNSGGGDSRQTMPETFVRQERKVGRNEPCPCGSGKKFKQCCGKVS